MLSQDLQQALEQMTPDNPVISTESFTVSIKKDDFGYTLVAWSGYTILVYTDGLTFQEAVMEAKHVLGQ